MRVAALPTQIADVAVILAEGMEVTFTVVLDVPVHPLAPVTVTV